MVRRRWLPWAVVGGVGALALVMLLGTARVLWVQAGRAGVRDPALRDGSPINFAERASRVFQLEDGEVLRVVPSEHSSGRALGTRGTAIRYWDGRVFETRPTSMSKVEIVRWTLGDLNWFRYVTGDWDRQGTDGDWVVRSAATREQKIAALEALFSQRLGKRIRLSKRTPHSSPLTQRVVVVSGRLQPGGTIDLFCEQANSPSPIGPVGASPPTVLLGRLSLVTGLSFIDRIEGSRPEVQFRVHDDASRARGDEQMRHRLLENVSRQTGLTFRSEVWPLEEIVIEEGG